MPILGRCRCTKSPYRPGSFYSFAVTCYYLPWQLLWHDFYAGTNCIQAFPMARFKTYLYSFAIAHLFFAVFLFFGAGIFANMPGQASPFLNEYYIVVFGVVATLFQTVLFTVLSKLFSINGITFFLVAAGMELLAANILFFLYRADTAFYGLTGSILLNGCLIAALFITMLIREYSTLSETCRY